MGRTFNPPPLLLNQLNHIKAQIVFVFSFFTPEGAVCSIKRYDSINFEDEINSCSAQTSTNKHPARDREQHHEQQAQQQHRAIAFIQFTGLLTLFRLVLYFPLD